MLDPVRFMTNRSSGIMGYAIAEAAVKRGARVTLVTGPVNLTPPAGVRVVSVQSTMDLYNAMEALCEEQDLIVQSAAPADYTPDTVADQKIKKQKGEDFVLTLRETPDVAAMVGSKKRAGQVLVGFAAETEHVLENAQKKLAKKNLDMICANDVSRTDAGFDVDQNAITLITREDVRPLELMSKKDAAHALLTRAMELFKQ